MAARARGHRQIALFLLVLRDDLDYYLGRTQPVIQTTIESTIASAARTAAAVAWPPWPCCGARSRPVAANASAGTPSANGRPVQNTTIVTRESTPSMSACRAG